MKLVMSFVSLAAILSMLIPVSVLGQGDFRVFVTDDDAIHELDLAATEGDNGQVNRVSGFAIEANSVVQINQNENLQVFTSTDEPDRIEKVKLTDHNGQLIELTKVGYEWSVQGFDDGVYLLDVIVKMPNGQTGAFETVLVILAPNGQKANPVQVINQVIKVETKTKTKEIIFKDRPKQKPKPSICYFDPDSKACDPDPKTGKCPPRFGFNDNDRCIPHGKCPSGYGRLDDDETGTCYPNKDIKRCPDGYIVHVREQCPPPVPEPIVCPAGQELSSDGLSCAPPCDGSYQDCIYSGHFCKAGSTEHACELPLEEVETETCGALITLACPLSPGLSQPQTCAEGWHLDDRNTCQPDDPSNPAPGFAALAEPGLSCQEEDDFCEPGCESPSMDCIDDVNLGDDGEDSTNELSCQPEDDFCEPGCESPGMNCIDDVNIGDDGEDSVPDEDEDSEEEEEEAGVGEEESFEEEEAGVEEDSGGDN